MSGLIAAGYFLFSTLFSFILFILWSRCILRFFRVSAMHPACQMIIRLTNPLVSPVNFVFTQLRMTIHRYDWPCLTLIILIELLKFAFMGPLFLNTMLPSGGILLFSLADLIIVPCDLLFYAIIIRVILSWIGNQTQSPAVYLIYAVTEPLLYPIRKRLPANTMLDFSPIIVILILKVISLCVGGLVP